jgi:hypothetical protein
VPAADALGFRDFCDFKGNLDAARRIGLDLFDAKEFCKRCNAFAASGRTAVNRGFALGNRARIGFAAAVSALFALSLRKHRVDVAYKIR